MVNWQVTATTIYCDAVEDEVTLLVYKDRPFKCTGYGKYNTPSKETASLLKRKSKRLKQRLECEGLECYRVTQYEEKLLTREAKSQCSEQPSK